jgi:hypothetical protein
MRHLSRRPLLDALARPRLAVGLAALCAGGAGAVVVGTSADLHAADAPPARATARTSGTTGPADMMPTRTPSPSRGGERHQAPTRSSTPVPAPQPTAAPTERPTPTAELTARARKAVRDTVPLASASSSSAASRTPSASPTGTPPDTRAPDTTIQTVAATGPAAVFRLGSDGTATYRCSVDGGAFTLCAPAVTLTGLRPGWHTLAAQAVDPAGNADPSPAQTRWHANGATP